MVAGISLAREDKSIYLQAEPSTAIENVTVEALEQLFTASDYARSRRRSAAIFHDCYSEMQRYFNSTPKPKIAFKYVIAEDSDARVEIKVADDGMSAEARFSQGEGGLSLSKSQVLQALRNAGVTSGIQRPAIDQLLAHSQGENCHEPLSIVIAKGKRPINGLDARFKPLVDDARKRVLRPQEREGGRVDMRDLGKLVSVNEGQAILEKLPPTKGQHGFTVKGQKLEASDGQDRELSAGNGVVVDPENNLRLLADRVGIPTFNDNSANVDEVLSLTNVDVSTGHIDFTGSVIVSGNVAEGMRVKAGGDITIAGYVDAAELHADGSITVSKGVIGKQLDEHESILAEHEDDDSVATLSTNVVAAGSVWVSYAQYAKLVGHSGVIVDKQTTHCHIVSQGTVCFGGEGKAAKGKLVGGLVETTSDLYCGQMGAPAGAKTRILFLVPNIASPEEIELGSLRTELANIVSHLRKLSVLSHNIQTMEASDRQVQFRRKLQQELPASQARLHEVQARIKELLAIEPPRPQLKAVATKHAYPNVQAEYLQERLRLREARGPTVLLLDGRELRVDSYS
ncbi:DUF342 domain-containing protein [Idiomarina xiamenensis]|uniref:Flagellar Assembly Protein A N-terminal region domain-containing protein n=1 Tax=Idiomarina xiamenensis 10-D-4 TaxID=740709 RepID=K2KBT3_9GAMM|nr:FapA family protein [Idiomarina xiamenensis]EKE85273.1 hypothetical protein A10D4_02975 [Idiomarina xiamenensis 10-D-4]